MNTVRVQTGRAYDIHIGSGLLAQIGPMAASLVGSCSVCIVSENNVWQIYGDTVQKSLEQAGFQVFHFVFPAGEKYKNADTYLSLLNFLAENQITRSDLLIALGGGVVGDLAGFAAATYLRGIRFVQVPTSLLAAVDASVGGKTAIDLPAGKNLAGAFYQPSLVICDIDTLNTLPEDVFLDGCAEVIKYAILFDPQLFSHLEDKGLLFDRLHVVTRCVQWKRDVVIQDEFDTGLRMKLNLGHTVGHSIEANSRFSVSHGKAVAIGTAIVARAAKSPDCDRILALLHKFGLPTTTDFSSEELYQYTRSDKKRSAETIRLIIPHTIGDCSIETYPIAELEKFIQAGL